MGRCLLSLNKRLALFMKEVLGFRFLYKALCGLPFTTLLRSHLFTCCVAYLGLEKHSIGHTMQYFTHVIFLNVHLFVYKTNLCFIFFNDTYFGRFDISYFIYQMKIYKKILERQSIYRIIQYSLSCI